jgi:hypothetical protein
MTTNQAVVILHRKEALSRFDELLERWRRSHGDKFDDLLHGRK